MQNRAGSDAGAPSVQVERVADDFAYHAMKRVDRIDGQIIHDALAGAAKILLEHTRECEAQTIAYQRLLEAKLWADQALCFERDAIRFEEQLEL